VALFLILAILAFAFVCLWVYELVALARNEATISADLTSALAERNIHVSRIIRYGVLLPALTIAAVFLIGDLVLELW
jgi:hypothetical protein